jgi:diguanylate cyclase (GGDEF)-like protein
VRATLDSLSAHVALVDPSGRIVLTNEAWRRFARAHGASLAEVCEGADYLGVCARAARDGAEEAAAFARGLRSVLGGALREFSIEYPCPTPAGDIWFVARATRFRAGGVLRGALVAHEDVTERKLAEEDARRLALYDPLTGLPNRRLLSDRLGHALSRAARDGCAVAVIYLDLDGFKAVNDSLDHDAGDRLLVACAERLGGCLREADTTARLGGDEFVVVVEGVRASSEALALARRIARVMKEPFSVEGGDGVLSRTLSASIGVAMSTLTHEHPGELVRLADLAMYRSKRGGRGRFSL